MKKLLLLFIFCPIFAFGQIGSLPYQLLRQSYRGDTVYTKLNGDSVNYYTDLGSFRFNKDIYVKGVKLGSGGSASSVIATQLKNYNANQDTVIRLPDLAAGKYGIYIYNNNGGSQNYIGTNSGYQNAIGTNNDYQNYINTNNDSQNAIYANNNYQNYINTNSGYQNYIITNNNYQNYINTNNFIGTYIGNSNKTAIGIKSFAADTVSSTSRALTGTFGKTASHLDIDGFGHTKLVQSTSPTVTLGTGAGTGATYSLTTGSNDRAGQITITTGTTPATDALIFTITYANPYKGNTFTCYTPASASASSVIGSNRPYANGASNTGTSLHSGSTSLSANTTYVWNYIVQQ